MTGKDLTGQRFGNLIVLYLMEERRWSRTRIWKCKCDCGNESEVTTSNLLRGHSKSCGCGITKRLPQGQASLHLLYLNYKNNASKRGWSFNLTEDEVASLSKQPCSYCGTPPQQSIGNKNSNGRYVYNGIDRIDNSKGYELDNCVPCCGTCNYAKKGKTVDEFYAWVRSAYNYRLERLGI